MASLLNTASRRGMLGLIAAAPLVAVPSAAYAFGPTGDAAIIAAWDHYRNNQYETRPEGTGLDEMRAAEDVLVETRAMTLAGIEAKLRVALDCLVSDAWVRSEALQAIGTPLHEHEPVFDFSDKLLFRALADLQRLSPAARLNA